MNGEELFDKLSKRDFSGSDADEYAQLLCTISQQLAGSGELPAFYDLLERAENAGKRISVADEEADELVLSDLSIS